MKAGVEEIEAAVESRRHVGFGVQDQRTDESRGAVTALVQDLRHERQQRRQGMAEIGDGVKLGIRPGKDRGMGNRRQRRLGIGFFKHDTLAGQGVQIRRKTLLAAQETHAVRAGGVHGDEDDVWSFRPDERARTQHDQQEKQEGTAHKGKKGVYHPSVNSLDAIRTIARSERNGQCRTACCAAHRCPEPDSSPVRHQAWRKISRKNCW